MSRFSPYMTHDAMVMENRTGPKHKVVIVKYNGIRTQNHLRNKLLSLFISMLGGGGIFL